MLRDVGQPAQSLCLCVLLREIPARWPVGRPKSKAFAQGFEIFRLKRRSVRLVPSVVLSLRPRSPETGWTLGRRRGLLARQVAGGTGDSCIFRLGCGARHSDFSLCIFIYETNHTITCRHVLNMTLVSAK